MPAPTPRTTPDLVKKIITVEDGVDLSAFIATANELTTEVCGDQGYTDGYEGSRMELIERWLSAHFFTIFDQQLAAAKAGTVSVSYQYKVDYGLANSMYGQQAIRLDTKGGLAGLDNTAKTKRKININMLWLGQRCLRQNDSGMWSDLTIEQ